VGRRGVDSVCLKRILGAEEKPYNSVTTAIETKSRLGAGSVVHLERWIDW
jgi:hypothetical protein